MKKIILKFTVLFLTSFALNATEVQQQPQAQATTRSASAIAAELLSGPIPPIITIYGIDDLKLKKPQFSPDGTKVLFINGYNLVLLCSALTGEQLHLFKNERQSKNDAGLSQSYSINSAHFSPDSKLVVTASYDGDATIWDVKTGKLVAKLCDTDNYPKPKLNSAQFSPDGKYVVTASSDNTAKIYDIKKLIATLNDDKTHTISNIAKFIGTFYGISGHRSKLTLEGHTGQVLSAEFSSDGNKVLTASSDGTARIWGSRGGTLLLTLESLDLDRIPIIKAQFSKDGTRVLTISKNKTAKIWDARSGQIVFTITDVNTAEFSPDGTKIAITYASEPNRLVRIFDASEGHLWGALAIHTDILLSAEFSPDGRKILTASKDGLVRIWDVETGQLIDDISLPNPINAVFSPKALKIVIIDAVGRAKIWDRTAVIIGKHFSDKFVRLKEQALLVTLERLSRQKNGGEITRADLAEMHADDLALNINASVLNALKSLYNLSDDIVR